MKDAINILYVILVLRDCYLFNVGFIYGLPTYRKIQNVFHVAVTVMLTCSGLLFTQQINTCITNNLFWRRTEIIVLLYISYQKECFNIDFTISVSFTSFIPTCAEPVNISSSHEDSYFESVY
jgi:hypothetical protein